MCVILVNGRLAVHLVLGGLLSTVVLVKILVVHLYSSESRSSSTSPVTPDVYSSGIGILGPSESTRREFRCYQHPTVRTCLTVKFVQYGLSTGISSSSSRTQDNL